MTAEQPTVYRHTVTTPSGLVFEASVTVPPDAQYADQHELGEVAQMGVGRMLGADADTLWRPTHPPKADPPACPEATLGVGVVPPVLRCAHPFGHAGPHRTADGVEWAPVV